MSLSGTYLKKDCGGGYAESNQPNYGNDWITYLVSDKFDPQAEGWWVRSPRNSTESTRIAGLSQPAQDLYYIILYAHSAINLSDWDKSYAESIKYGGLVPI